MGVRLETWVEAESSSALRKLAVRLPVSYPFPVPDNDFSDATLVLLGHGSTKNAESAGPVYQHAAELRRRGLFAEVREAFWKQEPQVKQVLSSLSVPRVYLVPLFISEGYFSSEVIPRELGFLPGHSQLTTHNSQLLYTRPVGTHDRMTGIVLARAREIVARFPFPRAPLAAETTLFIAGHGTTQNEDSRKAIDVQVERVRGRQEYAAVHGVFLEEEPRLEECYRLAQTKRMVVVPFFMSDGLHVREDIPVLLGEPPARVRERLAKGLPAWQNPTERHGKLLWCAPTVGTDPQVAEIIVERAREAAEGNEE